MATSILDKDDVSVETLSNMFKKGLDINDELENTGLSSNSDEFQHKVRKGILLLEDATRLVSLLDLFSRNETVSEVPTEHLKYFLLPAVLGNLHSKLVDQDRLEIIKIIEAYYLDYLRRIRDYEIANIPYLDKLNCKNNGDQPKKNQSKPDLAKMNRERDEKIQRFKESKILETSLKELKFAIEKPSCDDEVLRDYYLKLIRRFTFIAIDELTSFETEKEILQHMAKLREESGGTLPLKDKQPRRPLKPIIITRDALQKEVFGMGYKNLPVLSIEEFYDQRVRDGWYSNTAGATAQPSLQDGSAITKEEEESVQREILEENDDPVELARKRNFDDYKDEHKRGEGNRHNKG